MTLALQMLFNSCQKKSLDWKQKYRKLCLKIKKYRHGKANFLIRRGLRVSLTSSEKSNMKAGRDGLNLEKEYYTGDCIYFVMIILKLCAMFCRGYLDEKNKRINAYIENKKTNI